MEVDLKYQKSNQMKKKNALPYVLTEIKIQRSPQTALLYVILLGSRGKNPVYINHPCLELPLATKRCLSAVGAYLPGTSVTGRCWKMFPKP